MAKIELLDAARCVVVVINLQGKLMEMIHRPELVIKATNRLMQLAEIYQVPVVLTEQYPEGLGPTHSDVRATYDALTTPKRFMTKGSFGCCGDDGFEQALSQVRPEVSANERQIVIAGIEAHVCVMQTVIELLRGGQEVHVCWECVSSRGEEYRRHALERMAQAGAWITNHESAAFEWARTKDHAGFRSMNQLLREGQLT